MKRRTRQEWRELVEGHVGSGLTVSAYCARSSMTPASFYRWRALLGAEMQSPRATRTQRSRSIEPRSTVPFVDLGGLPAGHSRLELRVDLGGGVIVHLARG